MDSNLKLLLYIVLVLLLFWLGYTLYFRLFKKKSAKKDESFGNNQETPDISPEPGATGPGATPLPKREKNSGGLMICPICLFRMENGEMVKTTAFPSLSESKDRLMHIHGCVYCMGGKRERICPVCGKTISVKDFLVARIFDRSVRRSHVHVLGCTQCRPLKTM